MKRKEALYEAPGLVVLGSVREVTLGIGTDCNDAAIGTTTGTSVEGQCV